MGGLLIDRSPWSMDGVSSWVGGLSAWINIDEKKHPIVRSRVFFE